jgi:hypothetical protein
MSSPRKLNPQVLEELESLYTQLGDLNQQNNIIVKKAIRMFQPDNTAEFKKELGDLPERIKKIKEDIRVIETQHNLDPKLDSPSAPEKYRKG